MLSFWLQWSWTKIAFIAFLSRSGKGWPFQTLIIPGLTWCLVRGDLASYRGLISQLQPRPTSSTQLPFWSSSMSWGWNRRARTWLHTHAGCMVWKLGTPLQVLASNTESELFPPKRCCAGDCQLILEGSNSSSPGGGCGAAAESSCHQMWGRAMLGTITTSIRTGWISPSLRPTPTTPRPLTWYLRTCTGFNSDVRVTLDKWAWRNWELGGTRAGWI